MRNRSHKMLVATVAAVVCVTTLATRPLAAQNIQGLPRVSPRAVLTQTVGITDITIDYHRPSVNDRDVWGALVPDGAVWRAGANDNTTITFGDDVKVEGKELAAGTYGLHMIPGEGGWQVIFSANSTSWGSFSYDEAEDALRVEVQAGEAPFTEQLRYQFDAVGADGATIALIWDKVRVPIQVEVGTNELVLAKIRNDLRHLPGFNWQGWNGAAAYCLRTGINDEEALGWAERSVSMNENATNLITQSGLLAKLERADEAVEIETRAIAMASEGQLNQIGYRYLFQMEDTDRAIELFKQNVAAHPDSWNTYDSLGEAYAAGGDRELALENYQRALDMAPDGQKARVQGIVDGLME